MGHSKCRRTFLHVGHTRSLYVYEAHSDMCAYVTLRGPRVGYIRYESGDFVLSVCNVNGREHNIQQALIMCRRKSRFSEME